MSEQRCNDNEWIAFNNQHVQQQYIHDTIQAAKIPQGSLSDLTLTPSLFQHIKRSNSCGQDTANCNIATDRKKIKS